MRAVRRRPTWPRIQAQRGEVPLRHPNTAAAASAAARTTHHAVPAGRCDRDGVSGTARSAPRRRARVSAIYAGNQLGFPLVSQRYPHDDVQLPQLRWRIPLPPPVLSFVHLFLHLARPLRTSTRCIANIERAGSWKRTSGPRGRSPGSAWKAAEDVLEAFRERGVLDFRACVYATVPPRSRASGHSKIVDSTGSESIEQGDTGQHQPLEGCI